MNVGEKYALKWPKAPHLIDATIIALEKEHVVCECEHRCPITCYLQQMRSTLPIHGTVRWEYDEFARAFVRINPDAIALPGGFEPKRLRAPRAPRKKPHFTYQDFVAKYLAFKAR